MIYNLCALIIIIHVKFLLQSRLPNICQHRHIEAAFTTRQPPRAARIQSLPGPPAKDTELWPSG